MTDLLEKDGDKRFGAVAGEKGVSNCCSLLTAFIFIVGVITITLVLWSDKLREKTQEDAILLGAVMDLQINISLFHLRFDEHLAGEKKIDMQETIGMLEEGRRLAESMLNGGVTMHGSIDAPIEDPELRAKCTMILSLITKVRSLAVERTFDNDRSEGGLELREDTRFDTTFNLLLEEAKGFELRFIEMTAINKARTDQIYSGIFAAWILALLSSLIGLQILGKRQRRSLKMVSESESRLNSIVQTARDAIITINKRGEIIFWNEAAAKLFGYSADEIVGRSVTTIVPQRYREAHVKALDRFVENGAGDHGGPITIYGLRKDGTEVSLDLSLASWRVDGEIFFTSIIRDTSYKEKMVKLEKLAETDSLTEAYNRSMFDELLKSEMERSKRFEHPLSMLIFDIDNFKAINDTYGHLAGDEVLKSISGLVRKHIRSTNYFFRWGGEEFVILAVVTDIDGAVALAERIRAEVALHVFESVGMVTVSFGVSQYMPGEPECDFLNRTDKALYLAKSTGKNRVESIHDVHEKAGND